MNPAYVYIPDVDVSAPIIETFNATRPIEKTTSLKVYDYPRQNAAPERTRVADLLIPACQTGDQLTCLGNIQATNNQPYAIEFTATLRATQSSTGIAGNNIDYETGYNISPQTAGGSVWHGNHHGPTSLSGHYVIPSNGDWYVMIVAYAGGSSFTPDPYDWLVLDQLGDLSVQRVRTI